MDRWKDIELRWRDIFVSLSLNEIVAGTGAFQTDRVTTQALALDTLDIGSPN